jgi:hypothetical protein
VHLDRKGYGQSQFFRAGASLWFGRLCSGQGSMPSVESEAMRRAKQQFLPFRSIGALAVLSLIALLLVLSVAIASGAGHGFEQISLALPIFFVLLFLATSIGDWLQVEDFFTEPKPRFPTSLTRAPPA